MAHGILTPEIVRQADVLLAYLDPGSGSFILQLLVAGILGGLVAIRMYWSKIKARFTRKPQETGTATPEDKPDE
ncbi:MAG: hypothetical protein NTU91_10570 [Chloroflexi bacterium]|jgi:hypothetical protein|nr:hypothetical protein [Chloroflexota bacterium]